MTVPVFLLILLGILEFGTAFSHHLTLEYASREGARTGAALAEQGSDTVPCAEVDNQVIAAVQRVLVAAGSQVGGNIAQVTQIHIYRANNTNGSEAGAPTNVWVPGAGPTVDGEVLKFKKGAQGWNGGSACNRVNGANPDSIGVSIFYTYKFQTPLGSLMGIAGPATLPMVDRTVMALNPVVIQ